MTDKQERFVAACIIFLNSNIFKGAITRLSENYDCQLEFSPEDDQEEFELLNFAISCILKAANGENNNDVTSGN